MITWIIENIATIIVTLILILIVVLIVRKLVKDRRRGKMGCGCSCSGCSCTGCAYREKSK